MTPSSFGAGSPAKPASPAGALAGLSVALLHLPRHPSRSRTLAHCSPSPTPAAQPAIGCGGPPALLARCRLELHDQFGGYPAAVLYVNALGLGPLAYLGGVQPACRSPARAAGRPPGSTADSPGSIHVAVRASRSSWACLVFRSISYSVPSRPKRTVPSAALPSRSSINVDKQGLYLLGHGRSSPLTGL